MAGEVKEARSGEESSYHTVSFHIETIQHLLATGDRANVAKARRVGKLSSGCDHTQTSGYSTRTAGDNTQATRHAKHTSGAAKGERVGGGALIEQSERAQGAFIVGALKLQVHKFAVGEKRNRVTGRHTPQHR